MYTFVFLWTPALNPHTYVPSASSVTLASADRYLNAAPPSAQLAADGGGGSMGAEAAEPQLPHGFVFAIFMTASMVGTALAGRLMATWRLEAVLQVRPGRDGVGGAVFVES